MNSVALTGRLTREPEIRYGGQDNSTAIARFTLAVDDGRDTDFINIKCFGRTAEWAQKWLSKGSKAEAEARGQQLPESDGFMSIPEGADEELPFN